MSLTDKLINLLVIGGIGFVGVQIIKCQSSEDSIATCLIGNLSDIGGDITSGIVTGQVSKFAGMGNKISSVFTCSITGTKLEGPFWPKSQRKYVPC